MPAPASTQGTESLVPAKRTLEEDGWKTESDWHFARGEFDSALECSTKRLKLLEEKKKIPAIAETLRDIGRITLGQGDLFKAAKIFNASLTLYNKQNPQDENAQRLVLNYMLETELAFLAKEGYPQAKDLLKSSDVYTERRNHLKQLRYEMADKIKRKEPTEKILKEFSDSIGKFVGTMIEEMYPILGKPPCEFAILGLGSLARKEMSPYSDLEFALIIKDDSPENQIYFRKMVRWLEMKVIHLGETKINILSGGTENPIPVGFSFDSGGNTPFGKEGQVVLMQTPEKLAQLQSEKSYQEDMILSNVLKGASLLVGTETFFNNYVKAMNAIVKHDSSTQPYTIEEWRSLDLLSGHLRQFHSRIDESKKENPYYNVKEELYRLPNFLIAVLGDYFGINKQNTWDKLDALENKVLCKEGVAHLKEAIARALRLRIRCHLHYEREGDEVYHPRVLRKNSTEASLKGVYQLTDDDINDIIWIHRVLFPLERAFKIVSKTKDFSQLKLEQFYEDSPKQQAKSFKNLGYYSKAEECFNKAVILDPDDCEARLGYSKLLRNLERFSEAQNHVSEVFKRAAELQNFEMECEAYTCRASIYKEQGKFKEALADQLKAWEINREHLGDISAEVAEDLIEIGNTLVSMDQAGKAVSYMEEALQIATQIYKSDDPIIGMYTLNLGRVWLDLDALQAARHFETALEIFTHLEDDSCRVDALLSLALAYYSLDDFKQSHKLNKEIIALYKKLHSSVFTDTHFATILRSHAAVLDALKKTSQAKEAFEEAIGILKRVHGENHSDVASIYIHFSSHYIDYHPANALLYAQKALKIQEALYGQNHPDLVFIMQLMGTAHSELKQYSQAKQWYERALALAKKMPQPADFNIGHLQKQIELLST